MKPKLPSTSFRPPPRFQWPEGYRSALMLCFDIDGETTALSEDAAYEHRLTTMSQCTYGPCVGVPRILGLLEHYQINATFFVPTYVVEAHPRMTQIVHESGHELGVHGHLHERLIHLSEPEEAQILQKSLAIFESTVGFRPKGYRAPWYEINPWTPKLLEEQGFQYQSSLMSDDVPFFHANGLIEIPPQWHLEDWEQFAFNPDPAWGVIPEDCEKVYRLWWEELSAMRDYGCACVLTLHPWLIGRPARIQLLERILRKALELGDIWITTGSAIASHLTAHPNSRREVDLDA